MKRINILLLLALVYFYTQLALAEKMDSLALTYEEVEKGAGAQIMRYIINDQFMRIDNGNDNADFILFDLKKKNIYSVNHEDQTILKIENKAWSQPQFGFKVSTQLTKMKAAPKIQNKDVYAYYVKAGDKTCTEVFLIKDSFMDEMNVLYQYQQVLSGQQVSTLKNTPVEMHTPCFLVDQVYHAGDYFKLGLPVQISYSRDYVKFLKNYKSMKFDSVIFKLPESYSEYKAFVQ
jgi:hypothetical protein